MGTRRELSHARRPAGVPPRDRADTPVAGMSGVGVMHDAGRRPRRPPEPNGTSLHCVAVQRAGDGTGLTWVRRSRSTVESVSRRRRMRARLRARLREERSSHLARGPRHRGGFLRISSAITVSCKAGGDELTYRRLGEPAPTIRRAAVRGRMLRSDRPTPIRQVRSGLRARPSIRGWGRAGHIRGGSGDGRRWLA